MPTTQVTCKDITGFNGYLSKIYKYCVELSPADNGDVGDKAKANTQHSDGKISVILKVFSYQHIERVLKLFGGDTFEESKTAELIQKMTTVHTRECNFYSAFGKLGVVPLAKCYYTQELNAETRASGILVLPIEHLIP